MARIKLVLNERRLALIDAQQQVRSDAPLPEIVAEEEGSLFEEAEVTSTPPVESRP